MRNVVWVFAIVGAAFVAVHVGSYSAEKKTSAEIMNITEMQTVVNKNMPTTVIKDPL
jgi:formate/nitrite transporter FocA (FNT family)